MTQSLGFLRSPQCAWREVDGEALIVSLDSHRLRVLNKVGRFVWERLDGRSLDTLVADVVTSFAVDPETARRDVESFVRDLVERGLATQVGAGP